MIKTIRSFFAGCLLAAVAISAQASTLNVASITQTGTISGTGLTINFNPLFPTNNMSVGGGNTGLFAALSGDGSIANFANSTSATANPFMTFDNLPGWSFQLMGAYAASGSTLGPIITLAQLGPQVNATIGVYGTASDGSSPYTFTGILSTQIVGTNVATVQLNGITNQTWAGSFDIQQDRQNVPEPATLAMYGAGLLALGLVRRKAGLTARKQE